jgi:hypothetical protein
MDIGRSVEVIENCWLIEKASLIFVERADIFPSLYISVYM